MSDKASVEKICMIAGKIMLKSGAETNRIEDTMNRIAESFGVNDAQSYVTPVAINFSTGITEVNNFLRIIERPTDLHKVAEVNDVSRQIAAGELDLDGAYEALKKIENEKPMYKDWFKVVVAAFVSGCFAIMFQGSWTDFLPAAIAGGLGLAAMLSFERIIAIKFLAEFFGGFIIGISSYYFIKYGLGASLDKVIIGAVMPLVPGLHITNAIRDLVSGHLISGVSKGMEALMTAFALGAGVSLIFAFV